MKEPNPDGLKTPRISSTSQKTEEITAFGPPEVLDGEGKNGLEDSMRHYKLESGDNVYAGTDKGIGYKNRNEDRIAVHPSGNFVAVIDGMGGEGLEGAGEAAAKILAKALLILPENVDFAVAEAKREMAKSRLGEGGAVFISARIIQEKRPDNSVHKFIKISQSGDARLIIIGKEGTVKFASKDESRVQSLIDSGEMTPDQALYSPLRSVVLAAVSAGEFRNPKSYPKVKIDTGDLVFLMSDGISDNFTDEEIAKEKQEHNLSARSLFTWLSKSTDIRMSNVIEIMKNSKRVEKGVFSDGFKSQPKRDNRALAIIEIS